MVTLYHGGKDLEHDYKEIKPARTGKWEMGCGLYLTNSLERGLSYAKGSRKLYKVELDLTDKQSIDAVSIPIEAVDAFIDSNVKVSLRRSVKDDIRKWDEFGYVRANIVNNMMINNEALTPSKTPELTQFFIDHNVDYLMDRFGGVQDEKAFVLFNRDAIVSVKHAPSREIAAEDYEIKPLDIYDTHPQRKHIEQAYLRILYQIENELGESAHIEVGNGAVAWIGDFHELAVSVERTPVDEPPFHEEIAIADYDWDETLGNWAGQDEPHTLDFEALKAEVRQQTLEYLEDVKHYVPPPPSN